MKTMGKLIVGSFQGLTSCRHEQKFSLMNLGMIRLGGKGALVEGIFFFEKEFDGVAMNLHHLGIDVFVVLGVPRS